MGGQASDLVELIIRRVNGAAQPDPLIAELERRVRSATNHETTSYSSSRLITWSDIPGRSKFFIILCPYYCSS